MISRFESLPNEILFIIFCNMSWSELLICFWSLNKRLDLLIYSFLSRINNKENSGLVFIQPGLSFKKCHSTLFPLICQSSLSSSIRRMHFDETYSNSCELVNEWLFDNKRKSLRFLNIKSLILTRCLLVKSLIDTLLFLIKHQLDELTLIFDKDMTQVLRYPYKSSNMEFEAGELVAMFKELIEELFSDKCRLTSLKLDIVCDDYSFHFCQCLKLRDDIHSDLILNSKQIYCPNLRRLHIHINGTFFLENLIQYVPLLEQLIVVSRFSLIYCPRSTSYIKTLIETNGNWFKKVSKLKCFTLKSVVSNDLEFAYLKWLLNNVNHIEKLHIHLRSKDYFERDEIIWNSIIDANFVYKYCLPDEIINLRQFHFYIISKCKPLKNTNDEIIHSFKIHPFFLNRQWTNVKCFVDPIISYQHLSSSLTYKMKFYDGFIQSPQWISQSNTRYVWIDLHPSLHLFLEQFNELFPNVFCIKVAMRHYAYFDITKSSSLITSFEIRKCRLTNIQLRNVTRLDFNPYFHRGLGNSDESIDRNKVRAKLLAHLISMPVQLKDLRIELFEWLLHIIQYASDILRKDALNTVEYVEFYIPSCHRATNEGIHIGKNLVPFLSTYMPQLQTLRLWRSDDFPWTSIRPNFKGGFTSAPLIQRWYKSLQTRESIDEHVSVLEEDLNELVKQLKEFVFLEILGEIHVEKVEPYRAMVQRHFSYSRCNVEVSRFRLWL
ncbi:unnamed protein product [Adineta steineri]|uniref:F-box domain-containing protein n=1 Tax=Adineta steineri TaxID=433720 RepID=A0A815RNF6_9BILA|nr:unnamed protein product [Adineta steineri]CAF4060983.1 unnamed protein product [Adineta steineri]